MSISTYLNKITSLFDTLTSFYKYQCKFIKNRQLKSDTNGNMIIFKFIAFEENT